MKLSANAIEMKKIKCPSRFKTIWRDMLRRVDDKSWHAYHRYGGRGIKVCDEWRRFKNFYDDMYKSYLEHVEIHTEKNTTIERYDSDKDYMRINCRWATRQEQGANTARVVHVLYRGVSLSLSELSRISGIERKTLTYRIFTLGMTADAAVETSSLATNKAANHARWVTGATKYQYNGNEYTIKELAAHTGIHLPTLKTRIQTYHWSVEDAVNKPIKKKAIIT